MLIAHTYVAVIWQFLYARDTGVINYYLHFLGIGPISWLIDQGWVLPSVIVMDVWKNTGFAMLIFLAGLQNIPGVYYEAAQIDGASPWKRFANITLPLLSPTIFFVLVIFMIAAIQVFDTIIVLTGGEPGDASRSVVMYIYEQAFQNFDLGYASAIAVVFRWPCCGSCWSTKRIAKWLLRSAVRSRIFIGEDGSLGTPKGNRNSIKKGCEIQNFFCTRRRESRGRTMGDYRAFYNIKGRSDFPNKLG